MPVLSVSKEAKIGDGEQINAKESTGALSAGIDENGHHHDDTEAIGATLSRRHRGGVLDPGSAARTR